MQPNTLYILVRKDLDLAYRAVQGSHAMAAWLIENKETQMWNNNTLVFLEVDHIKRWKYKLDMWDIKYSYFLEPDLDNELTGIACQVESDIFKNLNLMGS